MTKLLITITGILAGSALFLLMLYKGERADRIRYQDNQNSLLSEIRHYKTKDSLNVASVQKLTLSASEFRKHNADLAALVQDLNLKVKRLQSVMQTATQTTTVINTIVKDSIVVVGDTVQTLRCIDYKTPYITFAGCIDNNQFSGLIESRDTIVQVVHREPRKFLFIRYGTKGIHQEILSKNPHTQITYTRYIEL